MRVQINGSSQVTKNALRFYLQNQRVGYSVVEKDPDFTVTLDRGTELVIDGVDGELERQIVNCIADLLTVPIKLQRAGGSQSDRAIHVIVPEVLDALVVLGVFRGLLKVGRHGQKKWWQGWR